MIFEELLELITEQDLVFALGVLTGLFLFGFLRGVLGVVSYFSKPRKPLVDKTEESVEVPWWEKTE